MFGRVIDVRVLFQANALFSIVSTSGISTLISLFPLKTHLLIVFTLGNFIVVN